MTLSQRAEEYCDDCLCLAPKEAEQSAAKEDHQCILHGRRVLHEGQHPRIPTPEWCHLREVRRLAYRAALEAMGERVRQDKSFICAESFEWIEGILKELGDEK